MAGEEEMIRQSEIARRGKQVKNSEMACKKCDILCWLDQSGH